MVAVARAEVVVARVVAAVVAAEAVFARGVARVEVVFARGVAPWRLVALLRRGRQVAALAQAAAAQVVLVLVAAVAWVEVAAGLAATVVARSAAPAVARSAATVVARLAAMVAAVVPAQRLDSGRLVVAAAVGHCHLPAPVGAAARMPGYRRLRQPVAGRAPPRCWQTAPRPAVAVEIPGSGVVGMAGRLPRPMAVGPGDH